ncbi:zinc ribbon domain-containing protein [Selenihalanaerobacter shriftii]|uniref:Double zinc ribbon n=1 Tax=Selenihalanaerobacter shriftii TaxID=142842 RepID=A0A1T4NVU7_9FIRM|nr:zinc ribbon domain-containing protein [Selenihalanaerobacter shriftii]SJZ83490.1 Double zinc ribbon [Selenihalanaerobacter shriftii]
MFLFWFIFCGVVAYFANERGRSPILWGLLAFLISPLLAGVALAAMKDLSIEEEIDRLDKTTENIKREIKSNQKYNEQYRKEIQPKLTSGGEHLTNNQTPSNKSQPALGSKKIKCKNCNKYVPKDTKYCGDCGNKIIKQNEKECIHCQQIISKESKFCPKCGQKLIIECSNCGKELTSDIKFCVKCGKEIKV